MASSTPTRTSLPHLLLFFLIFHSELVASFSCLSASQITRGRAAAGSRWSSVHAKSKGGGGGDVRHEGEVVILIHSHHLLDHKPDNMILSGKKFKLRGIACLGRPGVALCIGPRNNVKKFMNKLRGAMPQKKFGSVEIEAGSDIHEGGGDASSTTSTSSAAVTILDEVVDGFDEAPISELRKLLTIVGREDQFLALLGISNDSPTRGQTKNSNADAGESKGAGRKKRKRKS